MHICYQKEDLTAEQEDKLVDEFKRVEKVSEYDQEIPITNCRQTHGTTRKSHTTITRHKEDKLCKATSSLFPIKMIAKLEWT